MSDDPRSKGREMMRAVYGWDVGEPADRFVELTVDHLFGVVWAEGTLSVRERRLAILGLLLGTGQDDVVELQLDAAMRLGELAADEMRELVVLFAHYAGWPRAARLHQTVERLVSRSGRASRDDAPTSGGPPDDTGDAAESGAEP